jgi:hypothetical protein
VRPQHRGRRGPTSPGRDTKLAGHARMNR